MLKIQSVKCTGIRTKHRIQRCNLKLKWNMHTDRVKVTRNVDQKHLQSKFIEFENHVDMNNMLQTQFKGCHSWDGLSNIWLIYVCIWVPMAVTKIWYHFICYAFETCIEIQNRTSHLSIRHVCIFLKKNVMFSAGQKLFV